AARHVDRHRSTARAGVQDLDLLRLVTGVFCRQLLVAVLDELRAEMQVDRPVCHFDRSVLVTSSKYTAPATAATVTMAPTTFFSVSVIREVSSLIDVGRL